MNFSHCMAAALAPPAICGVTTGVGAVIDTARVQVGDNVVTFGLSGIGLNVIKGARLAGANRIIGVDIHPDREEWGRKFGMTDFLNSKGMNRDNVVAKIVPMSTAGRITRSTRPITPK
jgi:S-(hydroxymethyl)glutathione dehydrogenase / alcohol dehydrogenase